MTKVKKISFTAAVILMSAVTGSVLASSRVYVGGELGGASFTDSKHITYHNSVLKDGKTNNQGTGESGSIYLGVGQRFSNNFDLAGQLDASYFNANSKLKINTGGFLKEQINSAVGASIMPGWYFSKNSKVYLKIGAGVGEFKSDTGSAPAASEGYKGTLKKQDNYMVYGLGFTTKVSKNLRLGLEYDSYQFAKFKSPSEAVPGMSGATKIVNFKPTMNMGAMTLTYVW